MRAVVARSTFRSQNVKNTRGSDHFWRFRCRLAWQAQGILHLVKSEPHVLWHVQNDGRCGHLKRISKDTFSVAGAMQETSSLEMLGGPGGDFLRRVAFWSIRSSGYDRCSTSYDLASLLPGKTHWHVAISSASRRIASFLVLSRSQIEEVSQNYFVLDVVKFKK